MTPARSRDRRRLALPLGLLALVMAAPGCAGGPIPGRVIHDSPDLQVRLDVSPRAGRGEHDHPAAIDEQALRKALGSLSLAQHAGLLSQRLLPGSEVSPAFPDPVLDKLAPAVAAALQRATPLEEVLFAIEQPRDALIREITSGTLYVDAGRLHLVLANLRYTATGEEAGDRARRDPLTVLGDPLYDVVPGPYGELEGSGSWVSWLAVSPQHVAFDLDALTQPPAATAEDEHPPSPKKTEPGEARSTAERLRELERLREEGLITQQEYRQKRQHILDAL